MRIRDGALDDIGFLREMGYEAAFWRPGELRPPADVVLTDTHLARYLAGWGRPGDVAVVAEEVDGRLLGAAWYRKFTADEAGYGFVSEEIPELSIAVRPGARGRGIGSALLAALIDRARAGGVEALSLSVEIENPAMRLYQRLGFRVHDREAQAVTMRLDLA
jgi:ribosomal protein S18 acetylase RimI-like enzyme